MMKNTLMIIILVVGNTAFASEDDVIQGFAKYQAGRVETIFMNDMIGELKDNRYFKQMFSMTNEAIVNYNDGAGKRLIPLIQYFVKEDIKKFQKFSQCVAYIIYEDVVSQNIKTNIVEKIEYAKNTFKNKYEEIQKSLNDSAITISLWVEKNCDDKVDYKNKIKKSITVDKLKLYLVDGLKNSLGTSDHVSKNRYKFIKNLYDYIVYLKENPGDGSNSIKMHYIVLAVDKLGLNDGDKYYDFKKLALFLAQLSDAANSSNGDAEAVQAIITNYVNTEGDSYNIKRTGLGLFSDYCSFKICKPVVGIGSYFGFGAADTSVSQNRVYGPVGIELRLFNYFGHMMYLGYSPLDFGLPIKNELTEEDYSASFEDIRHDSVYLSYSYKHKPISVILSYHEDDFLTVEEDDKYYMLTIAYDLPIYFF